MADSSEEVAVDARDLEWVSRRLGEAVSQRLVDEVARLFASGWAVTDVSAGRVGLARHGDPEGTWTLVLWTTGGRMRGSHLAFTQTVGRGKSWADVRAQVALASAPSGVQP